jgi:hypothetical protein
MLQLSVFVVYLTTLSIAEIVRRRWNNANWMMNWKGCERKLSWPNKSGYPGIWLEGLRKVTKYVSRCSLSPDWNLNPRHPEYEAWVLTTRPRHLVLRLSSDVKQCYKNAEVMQHRMILEHRQYMTHNYLLTLPWLFGHLFSTLVVLTFDVYGINSTSISPSLS